VPDPPLLVGDLPGGARGNADGGASERLHPFDGRDLSMELEGLRACVDGVEGEHATEAGQLSQLVMQISNTLVDLGMLPIRDTL
jgi:hypothetical protein